MMVEELNTEEWKKFRDFAEMHAQVSKDTFDVNLDFSERSIEEIDKVITNFHPDGAALESTYYPYACYLGEVIIRNLGGIWAFSEERGFTVKVDVDSKEALAFVFAWVIKRFENGMDDSLAYKLVVLKEQLGLSTSLKSDAKAVEALEDTESKSNQTAELLAQGPALVFILIAGADGVIDKEEIEALQDRISTVQESKSNLFKAGITMMTADLNHYLLESQLSLVQAIDKLGTIKAEMQELFPDQARAYFEELINLAQVVADSSEGDNEEGEKRLVNLIRNCLFS